MRFLNQTGWINMRLRATVVSFATMNFVDTHHQSGGISGHRVFWITSQAFITLFIKL